MYVIAQTIRHTKGSQVIYFRGHDTLTASDYWTGKITDAVHYEKRKDAVFDMERLWGDDIKLIKLEN